MATFSQSFCASPHSIGVHVLYITSGVAEGVSGGGAQTILGGSGGMLTRKIFSI